MVCRVCGTELGEDLICSMCGENNGEEGQPNNEEEQYKLEEEHFGIDEEQTEQGKPKKVKKTIKIKISKKTLVYSLVVVVIIIAAMLIYSMVHFGLLGTFGQFPKGL